MFGTVVERAKATNQRRMVVTDNKELAIQWGSKLDSGIQVGWDSLEIPGLKFLSIADSKKALGKTFNNLVLDLRGSFTANDLGKLVPTVKGGGVIIILTPHFEKWALANLSYHGKLTIPPNKLEDCRHLFVPRLIRKLYEHEGIWIHRGSRWEKESIEETERAAVQRVRSPKNLRIHREITSLVKTQDQMDAIHALDTGEGISVLTADRGRGKSALLGLFVAALRAKRGKKTEVIVTAPSRRNVSVLMDFIEKGLDALKIPHGYKNEMLLGKQIKVTFEEPKDAVEKKADLFIVDEAAGIPLPLLKEMANKGRIIFSTTVHGYEGAGRTFSIQFLSHLKGTGFKEIQMSEPIRYSEGDPVEGWLFDTLLLDAEPASVKKLGKLESHTPEMKELFSDEEQLRAFFGLLVTAHYKNTPNDLMILADAPHHRVQLTTSGDSIVGGIQYAYEGGLSESQAEELFNEKRPEGNLIPDIFSKHYGLPEFTKLRGARVVRIVAHPKFFGKGIGSFSLKGLETLRVDWLGTSFGASTRLVSFWNRSGYMPITTSPQRNKISGEYSLLMVKPITDEAKNICEKARRQFSRRFFAALGDIYWDMSPGIAREILKGLAVGSDLKLDDLEKKRLDLLLSGKHIYELDVDIIAKLARYYFLSGGDYLTDKEELVLVSKVLQKATLRLASEKTGVEKIYDVVKQAVGKISATYFNGQ